MLVWAFFDWWYGEGWRSIARSSRRRVTRTYLEFSIPILLKTLFAPWRRIISYSSGTLGNRLRAYLDNVVSRCVGFVVRVLALVAALILMVLGVIGGALLWVIWPLAPLAGVILIFWGLLR